MQPALRFMRVLEPLSQSYAQTGHQFIPGWFQRDKQPNAANDIVHNAGVHGENPHWHRENLQTPHRDARGPVVKPSTSLMWGDIADNCSTVSPSQCPILSEDSIRLSLHTLCSVFTGSKFKFNVFLPPDIHFSEAFATFEKAPELQAERIEGEYRVH